MHKLSLSLLLVVVVAIFGLGLLLDALFDRYSSKPTDSLAHVRSLGHGLVSILNSADSPQAALKDWPAEQALIASIEDKQNLPLPPALRDSFESGEPLVLESDQGVTLYYYLEKHDEIVSLQSGTSLDAQRSGVAWLFTAAFYLGTLALVLLWLRPLLQRLTMLKRSAKLFGAGELSSRVPTTGVSYIQDLEQDFNRMADKVQQLVEDNKLLTSAVSHDLRTPLARLRFGIDTLSEQHSAGTREQYLHRINADLNEMESLVNSLLRYAKLDNVLAGIDKQPVHIKSLISECVSQHYDSSIDVRIEDAHLKADDTLIMQGCIEHLATLFNNLIQNAMDHAQSQIVISLQRSNNTIVLEFCDDGPGVPLALREQVVKPFERGATGKEGGFGLGLAVALRIAKHHGGFVEIDDCKRLGGALIRVHLSE